MPTRTRTPRSQRWPRRYAGSAAACAISTACCSTVRRSRGWLDLLTAIRQQCKLAGRYREIVILRIAILNRADYEYQSHIPFALEEGVTQQQIDALAQWQASKAFDAADRAVLAYTDSMTQEVHVPDGVFAPLRAHFDARELTELTATIAAYNLVSRFLEAVQIDHDA